MSDDKKTRTRLTDKPESNGLVKPSEKFKFELQSDGGLMESFKIKRKYIEQKYIANKATVRFTTPLMVPGNIYTFDYDPKNTKDVIYDRKPIVYSLGQIKTDKGAILELAIDFNLIPIRYKVNILDRLFEATKSIQVGFDQQKRIGYFPVNKDFISRILQNTGYRFALWHWIPQRINNKIVLEYSDWYVALHMLPYEVRGINLSQLEKKYLENLSLK